MASLEGHLNHVCLTLLLVTPHDEEGQQTCRARWHAGDILHALCIGDGFHANHHALPGCWHSQASHTESMILKAVRSISCNGVRSGRTAHKPSFWNLVANSPFPIEEFMWVNSLHPVLTNEAYELVSAGPTSCF